MIKKILMIFITLTIFSCGNNNKEKDFVISTWTGAGNNFEEEKWIKKINFYDSLGISEVLIGGSPEVLRKIIPIANKKNIKVHGWMWTVNRPGDTIANKNPEWYAVNRNGQNSLEFRAYVNYYQWLSPFHPEARNHIINNAKKLMEVDGLASVHLDYVRYPDVILGADLQPKYNIVQDTELPEYDYGYHPIAIKKFKELFNKDPLTMRNLTFRLNGDNLDSMPLQV